MDRDTDAELIRRAEAGDAAAFEALYRRHRDWIVRLAYRWIGDRDEALDVLQEVFASFFGKFPGFELSADLKTFLYPIVRHRCIDRLRRRRPTVDVDELAELLPAPLPGSGGELPRIVNELPAGQREVLLRRFVDDLSLEQIARALELPLGTVKSRLHNALRTLRERLSK